MARNRPRVVTQPPSVQAQLLTPGTGIQMVGAPRTDDQLADYIYVMLGVEFPRTAVCPDHVAPFQALADAYFGRYPVTVWKASRGFGGKSYMLACLSLIEAIGLAAQVNLLGGSAAQSLNVHEHTRNFWDWKYAPRHLIQRESAYLTKLSHGGYLRALMASQRSVRGPHPQRLRLDEIDEMDIEILDASLGQPMESPTVQTQVVMSSTHQYPDKCVAEGTMVLTRDGEVPVEDIIPGTQVLTRRGWRPVTAAVMSGYQECVTLELSNGRTLVCTDDHRVAMWGGGWTVPRWLTGDESLVGLSLTPAAAGLDGPVGPLSPLLVPLTLAADTPVPVEPGVLSGELVASDAVSLSGVDGGGTDTTENVHLASDGFQVFGVDAGPVTAQVVEMEPGRDRTDQTQPSPSVSGSSVPLPADPPVTLGLTSAPHPTPGIGVDLAPIKEPVQVISSHTVRVLQPTYDLTVEGEHEFVASGVVVHNTMSKILERAEDKGWPVMHWCYRENLTTNGGWLTPEAVERKRHEVTARMFEVEYDLQEPTLGDRAFDTAAVDVYFSGEWCEGNPGQEYRFEPYAPGATYVHGVDWAKRQDMTVIDTWRTDVDPWRRVAWQQVNRLPWPVIIHQLRRRVDAYPGAITHDATGVGDVVADHLDLPNVEGMVMTGRRRVELFSDYIQATEQGQFLSPKIGPAYNEHKYCSVEALFGKDHPPDSVVAGAMAWAGRSRIPRVHGLVSVGRGESYWHRNF